MTRRRSIITFIVSCALLFAGVILGYPEGGLQLHKILPASTAVPAGYYEVIDVYDGDTFAVNMNGKTEKIRLIGVDTPETHKPNTAVQCYGPEASDFTKRLIAKAGNAIRLEADPTGDNRDRYDRLLRYAYLPDNTLLQQALISQGYGFAYLSFTFTKKAEFAEAEANARNADIGIWGACEPFLKNGRWQSRAL